MPCDSTGHLEGSRRYAGANNSRELAMQEQSVTFKCEQDAQLVAQQLPQARVVGNQVFYQDKRALDLAIAVAGVSEYVQLPKAYPESERAYYGDNPRIYVACLSSYNNGYLHGLWIDATQDADSVQDDINWMLSYSPVVQVEACEEWAIHDYEGFGSFQLSEYESIEVVSNIAQAIEQHGEAFAAYVGCEYANTDQIQDWDEVIEKFQSAYLGHFDSEKDFALKSSEIDEMFDFASFQKAYPFWSNHVDWESVATDLFCQDYYSVRATDKGWGIYVFRNC
jgi:antirestriction protein